MLVLCEKEASKVWLTVRSRSPASAESVDIRAADSRVRNFNVYIVFVPSLGLKLLPDHVALDGLFVQAHPALEFVVLRGHDCVLLVID